jgi:hypothetical protein
MGRILRNWRIGTAVLFALVLVVGSYLASRGPVARASTESELLGALATRDSDADGLKDWEEALYGTSPTNPDTRGLGMNDGEAVKNGLIVPKAIADVAVATSTLDTDFSVDGVPPPADGTLTAAFAQSFFATYLSAKEAKGDAELTEAELQDISSEALSALSATIKAAPNFKTEKDINVSGAGAAALSQYAATAEGVLLSNRGPAAGELSYLKILIEEKDPRAIEMLVALSKMYRQTAIGLSQIEVPQEVVSDHVLLVNAYMRLSEIINDFARANVDPLAGALALQLYPEAVLALGNAYKQIGALYERMAIVLPTGTSGAAFVHMANAIPKGTAPTAQ